jgi:hypothetical protein
VAFPFGPQKTPKPANPKVHRLWLEEHMGAAITSSRGCGHEKTRTLRASAARSAFTVTHAGQPGDRFSSLP